jgi:hypothetical protein
MVHGTLEVLLVGAKGLENTDYLCTHQLHLQHSPFSCYLLDLHIGVHCGFFPWGPKHFGLTIIIARLIFIGRWVLVLLIVLLT